jgi:hypothetical protein
MGSKIKYKRQLLIVIHGNGLQSFLDGLKIAENNLRTGITSVTNFGEFGEHPNVVDFDFFEHGEKYQTPLELYREISSDIEE